MRFVTVLYRQFFPPRNSRVPRVNPSRPVEHGGVRCTDVRCGFSQIESMDDTHATAPI
jgi:hypothetical protein